MQKANTLNKKVLVFFLQIDSTLPAHMNQQADKVMEQLLLNKVFYSTQLYLYSTLHKIQLIQRASQQIGEKKTEQKRETNTREESRIGARFIPLCRKKRATPNRQENGLIIKEFNKKHKKQEGV